MRGSKLRLSTIAAGISALFAFAMGGAAQSADFTLKYSDHDPLGGMRPNFVKEVWLAEIEKQSGGKVKFQDFWGGALMSSKEILKGIGDGVTDLGFVFPGHYPTQLVAHSVYNLFPRGPNNFQDMIKLYRAAYDQIPELNAELKKANVKILMITAGLPGAFAGKKPLPNIQAIKGDKWRAGDKWKLKFLENSGSLPVAVPWGDVYVSLQTGTIEGVFTNYDGIAMMKFDEVAPNLMISKELWYAAPFMHLMNADKFAKLPKDVQDAITKASEIAEQKFAGVYDAAFDKVKNGQIQAGRKVVELSAADLNQWESKDKLAALQAEWVAEAEKNGLATAKQVMEKMKALITAK